MEKDTITGSYDIIIMKNGNEVLAKILEIGINEIKFKKFNCAKNLIKKIIENKNIKYELKLKYFFKNIDFSIK